jgi:hypothetical protein
MLVLGVIAVEDATDVECPTPPARGALDMGTEALGVKRPAPPARRVLADGVGAPEVGVMRVIAITRATCGREQGRVMCGSPGSVKWLVPTGRG